MEIRTEHLTKRYGSQVAVDDVSFRVREGEVLGFLGPNGAGKTTTMRMICGLIGPDNGQVFIGDRLMDPGAVDLRRAIGYLPETNPLYEDMPVLDLLRFGAKLQGVPGHAIDGRIREMVDACGLGDEKHKRTGELSRGYRQRAGLAFAMVHDPAVLVLDEPTTGLDPNQIIEVRTLIKELGKTKTVVFSTHILPEAEAVCDRILIINKGRIVADGTSEQLRTQVLGRTVFHVRISGAGPDAVLPLLRGIQEVVSASTIQGSEGRYEVRMSSAEGERIFTACSAQGWSIGELRPMESRLEDVFRDATNR
ncbi:MAG: ATP-binding cassette domain-containing protein [Flavobacteriales bacterium]|jgi:ABC-2 type transport system ATP-binding protein|nr:ATP-binding cassette domain-containing protein [Flavobacteriales bacterium]MCB0759700.1 ATP-binding cassette domain-containing protein [Flavobacteriales bacterium]